MPHLVYRTGGKVRERKRERERERERERRDRVKVREGTRQGGRRPRVEGGRRGLKDSVVLGTVTVPTRTTMLVKMQEECGERRGG